MQHFYLDTEKENSDFHWEILGEDFDLSIFENSDDSLNIAHLSLLPSKFEQLKDTVLLYVDVLVLTETKLDDSFPKVQFLVDRFSEPYRYDRNRKGGGIMIYISENIQSKLLEKHNFSDDIEGLFVELNFRKVKWLLFGTYHPPSQNDIYYFNQLD